MMTFIAIGGTFWVLGCIAVVFCAVRAGALAESRQTDVSLPCRLEIPPASSNTTADVERRQEVTVEG